jgi:hypothetical protein
MTKEEIETHCQEIIGWLKDQQPRMPKAYIGTVDVPVADWCHCSDDFMKIVIDNFNGLRVWFATCVDEYHNHECYPPWELRCALDYKCALLANWKDVKKQINDLIEERTADINRTNEEEARMCAKITECQL